jgi:hypothetical protein
MDGRVPSRLGHWHDFFNALCWCVYPKIKAALNARQVMSGLGPRTSEQNLLAMFDEGGIVRIAGAPEDETYVVGHALFEGAVRGQSGLTGCLAEAVIDSAVSVSSLAERLAAIDAAVAGDIALGRLRRAHSR